MKAQTRDTASNPDHETLRECRIASVLYLRHTVFGRCLQEELARRDAEGRVVTLA